jgi:polyphosphate kinase
MKKKSRPQFFNRELSWLEFNDRVLSLAFDTAQPLLERVKFLAITASNLDEFLMVRVGGLQAVAQRKMNVPDFSGLTPRQQLSAIDFKLNEFVRRQYECFQKLVSEDCKKAGIVRTMVDGLSDEQAEHCAYVFEHELFPVLTPIAVSAPAHVPLLSNRSIYLCVRISPNGAASRQRFAVIHCAKNIGRCIGLPGDGRFQFMLLEDLLSLFVNRFFPGERVLECAAFRVVRNADVRVAEDSPTQLLEAMENVIDARKRSSIVRLEIDRKASPSCCSFLQAALDISKTSVHRIDGPLDLSAFMRLTELNGCEEMHDDPLKPLTPVFINSAAFMFDVISKHPVLLIHPYESFDPVLRFIDEAASDPDVLAIKQTLYRTSRASPVVASLIRAAENGKSVTAVVELKARFDEERNIEWARELEDAGVQVIQGVRNLKTHAKICIVVRRESHGLQRYVHVGTGNYNEITARIYSDVSFFTADPDIGADASAFFNAITGRSEPLSYRRLSAAPLGLRETIIGLIDAETQRKKQGLPAWIDAKMNSLVDQSIIESLYAASRAGVRIRLNVRGICCLAPGIKGLSENISVVSIVDRFLEHSRILSVCNGGTTAVFISSADWMPRNLDKRVELFTPVDDPACRTRLIDYIGVCLADNTNSWRLLHNGEWARNAPASAKKAVRCQRVLYERYNDVIRAAKRGATMFHPHGGRAKSPAKKSGGKA